MATAASDVLIVCCGDVGERVAALENTAGRPVSGLVRSETSAQPLRAAEPVLREAESPYSNRIHADDLAQVCVAAGHYKGPGTVYNASGGHPTTMTDFFFRVADLLGIPRPPTITLEEARRQLGEGMLSCLAESRRIDHRRLREELGVELMYPDLASGPASCLGGSR